jgi:hypothetical protein
MCVLSKAAEFCRRDAQRGQESIAHLGDGYGLCGRVHIQCRHGLPAIRHRNRDEPQAYFEFLIDQRIVLTRYGAAGGCPRAILLQSTLSNAGLLFRDTTQSVSGGRPLAAV